MDPIVVSIVLAPVPLSAAALAVRMAHRCQDALILRVVRSLLERRAAIFDAQHRSLAAWALAEASESLMASTLAPQSRDLQALVELGVVLTGSAGFQAPLPSRGGAVAELSVARKGRARRSPMPPQVA